MANITRKWKRLLAVSCSHGPLIDRDARAAVLTFIDRWKPETRIHLGDFCDMTAFRSGAHGTKDESEPIGADVDEGLGFLAAMRATHVFFGNHEDRLVRLSHHYNAIVAECAQGVLERIETRCKLLKADQITRYSITENASYRLIGGYRFMHGWIYNENAPRDHAESVGNCVFGHTHRAGVAKGRRLDNPTGFCVGTLTRIANMDYAKTRRSTLAWTQGFVWGEYCSNQAQLWLHENPKGTTTWHLPV